MKLLTMGLREAEAYSPIGGEAILSISFADGSCTADLSRDWQYVCYMSFDDCTPDRAGLTNSAVEITEQQARQIVAWVKRLHREGVRRLVIHCFAGVSRSTSVACALRDAFGWEYGQRPAPLPAKNQPVYLAILEAALAPEQS